MQIYDISNPITAGMVVWPDNPPVTMERTSDMDRGDLATVSKISMGVHTGTHVDAPLHFVPGGAGVEALALAVLVGPALVVHVPADAAAITAALLAVLPIPPGTTRLLFQTRNSSYWQEPQPTFHTDFVAVTEDGAQWVVDHGVRLVGVDYLSVAPYDAGVPTHRVLLTAGVITVEGLNLAAVAPGLYTLVCLPLLLPGSDGAPARVILIA